MLRIMIIYIQHFYRVYRPRGGGGHFHNCAVEVGYVPFALRPPYSALNFTLLDRAYHFLIIITPRSSNLLRSITILDFLPLQRPSFSKCHLPPFAIPSPPIVPRFTAGHRPNREAFDQSHKGLLIQRARVVSQIWWSYKSLLMRKRPSISRSSPLQSPTFSRSSRSGAPHFSTVCRGTVPYQNVGRVPPGDIGHWTVSLKWWYNSSW